MTLANQTHKVLGFKKRNETNLNLNTINDENDKNLLDPNQNTVIKHSKSSMNKNGVKKPTSIPNHPNCGKVRHQPISVWDQLQVHDSQLYQKEMEEKRIQKKQEQLQMREILQNQIKGNTFHQKNEKMNLFEVEKTLVNQAVKKVAARE